MADQVQEALDRLARELTAALGETLAALVLYGSRARGTAVAGRSDANLLLLVTDATGVTLHRAAPALAAWTRSGQAPPLIQTEAEWRAAADVFPLEIEDMREAHQVLAGRDPFDGLTTTRADQRRALERELRGKLAWLRAGYAATAPEPQALTGLLVGAVGTLLVLCRAVVRLTGRPVPPDASAVVREAAAAAAFDPEPLLWALTARGGPPPRPLTAYDPIGASLLAAVERVTRYVNDLPTA
jgi:hypothetical protein